MRRILTIISAGALALTLASPNYAEDNEDDKLVPLAEVTAMLEREMGYLYARKNPSGPAAPPASLWNRGPHFTFERKVKLLAEARASGMSDEAIGEYIQMLPNRVQRALEDFYESNREPLHFSLGNINAYRLPVKRAELKRLAAAVDELKKHEAVLLELQAKEWAVLERTFRVLIKVAAVGREVAAVRAKHRAPINDAFNANDQDRFDRVYAAYRREMEPIEARLEPLEGELAALDKEDRDLAAQYVRKLFTFEIPSPYRGSNKARPIVDGRYVYARIAELMTEVAEKAAGKGYVYISLWGCDAETRMTETERLGDLLAKVRAAGNEVALILWRGDPDIFPDVDKYNDACAKRVRDLGGMVVRHSKRIIGSHHEKFFIISNGAEVRAIIGGLNIDAGSLAAAPHRESGRGWRDVHDVAVELAGPAVEDLERYFRGTWDSLTMQRLAAAAARSLSAGTDEVYVATNGGRRKERIYRELLARIDAAEKFIYLENYAIHEEGLVRAIGRRLAESRARSRPLDVILVIHNSSVVYEWVHWITYLHLSFMSCDSFTYRNREGQLEKVERKKVGTGVWRVGPYEGKYYESTRVYWDGGSADLASIESFDGDTPLYRLAYHKESVDRSAAPLWVHSKVAIFDDAYAAIGSANFNPRSMFLDEEATAFVRGDLWHFRTSLWNEYALGRVPEPQAWRGHAEQNRADMRAGTAPADRILILPMHMEDFPRRIWRNVQPLVRTFVVDATWY